LLNFALTNKIEDAKPFQVKTKAGHPLLLKVLSAFNKFKALVFIANGDFLLTSI